MTVEDDGRTQEELYWDAAHAVLVDHEESAAVGPLLIWRDGDEGCTKYVVGHEDHDGPGRPLDVIYTDGFASVLELKTHLQQVARTVETGDEAPDELYQ